MWTLEKLQEKDIPQTNINGRWVPARPMNFTKGHTSYAQRLKRAWAVFTCKADAFVWPEGQ